MKRNKVIYNSIIENSTFKINIKDIPENYQDYCDDVVGMLDKCITLVVANLNDKKYIPRLMWKWGSFVDRVTESVMSAYIYLSFSFAIQRVNLRASEKYQIDLDDPILDKYVKPIETVNGFIKNIRRLVSIWCYIHDITSELEPVSLKLEEQ